MTMYENLEKGMQKIAQDIMQENKDENKNAYQGTYQDAYQQAYQKPSYYKQLKNFGVPSNYDALNNRRAPNYYGASNSHDASNHHSVSNYYGTLNNCDASNFYGAQNCNGVQNYPGSLFGKMENKSQKKALSCLLQELLLEILKQGGFSLEQFLQANKEELEGNKAISDMAYQERSSKQEHNIEQDCNESKECDESKECSESKECACGDDVKKELHKNEQDLHEQVEKLRKLKLEHERSSAARRQKAYELELKQKQNCAKLREQYELYFQKEDELIQLAQQEYDQMRRQLIEAHAQAQAQAQMQAGAQGQIQTGAQEGTQGQAQMQRGARTQAWAQAQEQESVQGQVWVQAQDMSHAQSEASNIDAASQIQVEPEIQQLQPEVNVQSQMHLQPQFQAQPRTKVKRAAPKNAKPVQLKTPLISVVSASGGTGRSTIALLSAFLCARSGLSTVLIEGDLQFGDFAFWLNLDDECSSLGDKNVEPLQIAENLKLYKAPLLPEVAEEVSDDVAALLPKLASGADIVIADTGGFWNGLTANLLLASELFLMVIDKRPSSVLQAVKAAELCSRIGVPTLRMVGVYNRYSSRVRIEKDDAKTVLDASEMYCIPQGKQIVEDLLSKGDISELIASENPVVLSVDKLLTEILPRVGCEYTEMRFDSRRFLRGRI